jgi:3-deoxy-D-manno-octulosonic-acid transferase
MMYALYNLLLGVAGLAVVPALKLPRFHAHRERLGIYPAELRERLRGQKVIWLHNASVGELLAARPLLAELRRRCPDFAIVLSTTSLAGRELARGFPEADGAVLLPLDLPACVERALGVFEPRLFVFTETELWPNLLRALASRRTPTVLLSGRISPRAFRRYRWVRPFLRRVLGGVTLLGMQSESEAERIRALGAPPERVQVTGNLKLDGELPAGAPILAVEGPLWFVASTHAGEEEICLRVFKTLKTSFPALRVLLAPRHLDRQEEVERALRAAGVGFVRRSRLEGVWRGLPEVLLLDTLGELAGLYPHAAVAFVGGTLVPVGGHNLLEPARAAVPVLFGPHVESVSETAARLEAKGGGRRVADEAELGRVLGELLGEPTLRGRMGGAAREAFGPAGAVEASAEVAASLLEPR